VPQAAVEAAAITLEMQVMVEAVVGANTILQAQELEAQEQQAHRDKVMTVAYGLLLPLVVVVVVELLRLVLMDQRPSAAVTVAMDNHQQLQVRL